MVANQQVQHPIGSRHVLLACRVSMVHRLKGAGPFRDPLGSVHPLLWRICVRGARSEMSDFVIFLFGLVATLFTLGPLAIAAISELREKDDEK